MKNIIKKNAVQSMKVRLTFPAKAFRFQKHCSPTPTFILLTQKRLLR